MSIIVNNNQIELSNTDKCYSFPDKKFSILWSAFYNTSPKVPRNQANLTYTFPQINLTTLQGITDELSGFILFKRTFPPTEEQARNSPIINEGIALDCYYSGIGYKLYYEFEYSIENSPSNRLEVYSLTQGQDMIKLFVDTDNRPSIYYGSKGSFIIHDKPLFFFRCEGVLKLNVRPIDPLPFFKPLIEGDYCLKISCCGKRYSSKLYNLSLSPVNGLYITTIYPEWRHIANKIQLFFEETALPIPIAPIIPIIGTTYTLFGNAGDVLSPLNSADETGDYLVSNYLYGQFNNNLAPGFPSYIPYLTVNNGVEKFPFPDGLTHLLCPSAGCSYYTLIPGEVVNSQASPLSGVVLPEAVVTVTIYVPSLSNTDQYGLWVYPVYYIAETSYPYNFSDIVPITIDPTMDVVVESMHTLSSVSDLGLYFYTDQVNKLQFTITITYII